MTRKQASFLQSIPFAFKSTLNNGPQDTLRRVRRYIYGKKTIMPLPTFVQIELTTLCNFKCTTCSRESLPTSRLNQSISSELVSRLLSQLPGLREVKLQGLGEPLMTPGIRDIISIIREHNSKVKILTVTNGSLLSVKKYREIALSVDDLRISFDSTNKDNFEKIRVNSNYSKILEGIRLLINERNSIKSKTRISLDFVATHLNYGEIPDLEEVAISLGIDEIGINEVQNWYIPSQDEYVSESKFIAESRNFTIDIKRNFLNLRKKLQPHGIKVVYMDASPMKNTCTWPFNGSFITSDGYVTSCCIRMDPDANNFGNIFKSEFKEIWNNEKYVEFRKAIIQGRNNGVCDHCPN